MFKLRKLQLSALQSRMFMLNCKNYNLQSKIFVKTTKTTAYNLYVKTAKTKITSLKALC